jgi:predicted RNase H-like nuclease (RuvC/YqgF family)
MHEGHGEEHPGFGRHCWHEDHHGYGQFTRRFLTKEEKIKKLEEYTQELKNELAAVQERIKELKAK